MIETGPSTSPMTFVKRQYRRRHKDRFFAVVGITVQAEAMEPYRGPKGAEIPVACRRQEGWAPSHIRAADLHVWHTVWDGPNRLATRVVRDFRTACPGTGGACAVASASVLPVYLMEQLCGAMVGGVEGVRT